MSDPHAVPDGEKRGVSGRARCGAAWRRAFLALCAVTATTGGVLAQAPLPPHRPHDAIAPESHGSAVDLDIPVPPPRPTELTAPAMPPATQAVTQPTPQPLPPVVMPRVASQKDTEVCQALLDSGVVQARRLAPIGGNGECGIEAPIALEAVVLADKRAIKLEPAPTIRCDLAAVVARWVTEDVAPALAAQNLTLERIVNADSYSCRSRNHVTGAKLSEHALGNAIDIDSFVVAPSRRISLTSPEAMPFAATIRASACARFTTILGPGSDGYHNNHIHLDIEDRRTHGTLCQWNLMPAGPSAENATRP